MRRRLSILGAAMLVVAGCGTEAKDAKPRYFATKEGLAEFLLPAGWRENPRKHPFDLQCFSPREQMNTGVFLYQKVDLAADFTPRRVFENQIEDMRGKRKNFKLLEPETSEDTAEISLTSAVYSAEKGDSTNYYRFTLVEFAEDPGVFAVVLQICVPSHWSRGKPILAKITKSARLRAR